MVCPEMQNYTALDVPSCMCCVFCRTLRLLTVGVCDELRRLLHRAGFNLPPVYLRLVAPMNDPKALALLPLKVCCRGFVCKKCKVYKSGVGWGGVAYRGEVR
jgi:hypothetical protein